MRLVSFVVALLGLALAAPVHAQPMTANGYNAIPGAPAIMSMPFMRSGDPFILPATTTPQTFQISQPDGTFTYRAVNRCEGVDVRIKTVAATAPIVVQPTAYPGVSLVTSGTGSVSPVTGTTFMGRFGETLGSSAKLTVGSRLVSIMIVPIPTPGGSTYNLAGFTCPFELQYGNSS